MAFQYNHEKPEFPQGYPDGSQNQYGNPNQESNSNANQKRNPNAFRYDHQNPAFPLGNPYESQNQYSASPSQNGRNQNSNPYANQFGNPNVFHYDHENPTFPWGNPHGFPNHGLEIISIKRDMSHSASQPIQQGQGEHLNVYEAGDAIYSATSNNPAAFQLIKDHDSFKIGLAISFQVKFLPGLKWYALEAIGQDNFRLESDPFQFPVGNGKEEGAKAFDENLTFSVLAEQIDCPCKVEGKWEWKLYEYSPCQGKPGLNAAKNLTTSSSQAICMELYFFLGLSALRQITATQNHWIDLIRLTIPQYAEIKNLSWNSLEYYVLAYITRRLWNFGGEHMKYDSRLGEGGWPMHGVNGQFNIGTFFKPNGGPGLADVVHRTCNCYDLAKLVWVGCRSLGMKPNNQGPFMNVYVAYGKPWGYVPPGQLYGQSRVKNCNNPFYLDTSEQNLLNGFTPAWLVNQDWEHRTDFSEHCVTVYGDPKGTPDSRVVIDICHVPEAIAVDPMSITACLKIETDYLHSATETGYQASVPPSLHAFGYNFE